MGTVICCIGLILAGAIIGIGIGFFLLVATFWDMMK